LGLLCDEKGCLIAVEVFSGNTNDASTIKQQIEKIRNRFGIESVAWVGDQGMITNTTINIAATKKELETMPEGRSLRDIALATQRRTRPLRGAGKITICLNTVEAVVAGKKIVFEKITQPTPLQQKALDLLGVRLVCIQ